LKWIWSFHNCEYENYAFWNVDAMYFGRQVPILSISVTMTVKMRRHQWWQLHFNMQLQLNKNMKILKWNSQFATYLLSCCIYLKFLTKFCIMSYSCIYLFDMFYIQRHCMPETIYGTNKILLWLWLVILLIPNYKFLLELQLNK
jgi:hypothetical protein